MATGGELVAGTLVFGVGVGGLLLERRNLVLELSDEVLLFDASFGVLIKLLGEVKVLFALKDVVGSSVNYTGNEFFDEILLEEFAIFKSCLSLNLHHILIFLDGDES